jgi:protein SCO1/2
MTRGVAPWTRRPSAVRRAIRGLAVGCAALAMLASAGTAGARPPGSHLPPDMGRPANDRPAFLNGVGIDQKLDAQVPPDLVFTDETGKVVRLGDYFGKKPIVLSLVYFECPGLCTVSLNELERTLKGISLNMPGSFEVLTVSFDPSETPSLAAAKKASHLKRLNRAGAQEGWHFLTGDPEPIRQLTEAVGFRYQWDDQQKQFVHSSGIIVLTPQGRVSQYFVGIDYAPQDVRLSLQKASGNQIGTIADKAVLYCFKYNPTTGKYGLAIDRALKLGGVLTVLSLATFIFFASRRDRTQAVAAGAGEGEGEQNDGGSPGR